MKMLNNAAMLLACAAFTTGAAAQSVDNWRNGTSELVWMNGTGELCWRNSGWTPATAAAICDGAPKTVAVVAPPPPDDPAPAAAPEPAPAPPPPAPMPVAPAPTKVTLNADAYFDFDKSVLKPQAKAELDDLAAKSKDIELEAVIAVGHTDAIGTNDYNQRLSVRRANAVKEYLVSRGIDAKSIYTEGKGETQPKANNTSRQGRAQNRRVEVEAVGTR